MYLFPLFRKFSLREKYYMDDKFSIVKLWIRKSNEDLTIVKELLNLDHELFSYDLVCYHCQQAAEKYLKAYLIYLEIPFPFIHDLTQLLQLILEKDHKAEQLKECCFLLTPYSSQSRYPDNYDADFSEAKEAFRYANEITSYLRNKMKEIE